MIPQNFQTFRSWLRGQCELLRELGDISDHQIFFERLASIGREQGFFLQPEDIATLFSNRSFDDLQDERMEQIQLQDWIPGQVDFHRNPPGVDWYYVGEYRFDQPFFEDSLRVLRSRPINRFLRFHTSLDSLSNIASRPCNAHPSNRPNRFLEPTGFIFHTSRCGSSLISRMISSLPQCVVMSEASPIDAILRSSYQNPTISQGEVRRWIQDIVHLLGISRRPEETYYFIKFDCWHTLAIPFIRQVYPDVPWIFLYRSPEEVMVSHKKVPGSHIVPGLIEPEWYGWTSSDIQTFSHEEYGARALGKIYQAAVQHHQPEKCRLIHYTQLPGIVESLLLDFFGVEYTPEQIETLREVSRYNAKHPSFTFTSDTEEKKREATETIQHLAAEWITPWYDRLEALRRNQIARKEIS